MQMVKGKITIADLNKMSKNMFDWLVKAVVDIKKEMLIVDAQMHADEEKELLEQGSKQEDLWGANLYPNNTLEERIEYLSLINIRPQQNNRQMYISDKEIREKVKYIVYTLLLLPNEQMA